MDSASGVKSISSCTSLDSEVMEREKGSVKHLLILVVFLGILLGACSEQCVDVACGPAPPLILVIVSDSVVVGDTTLYQPVLNADVRLYADDGTGITDGRRLDVDSADSLYRYSEAAFAPDEQYGVVAERGGKSDTVRGLSLHRVEGCCPQEIIGRYTIDL